MRVKVQMRILVVQHHKETRKKCTLTPLRHRDDIDVLVAPGIDGELGVLPSHAPLLTVLQPGEILIRKDGDAILRDLVSRRPN